MTSPSDRSLTYEGPPSGSSRCANTRPRASPTRRCASSSERKREPYQTTARCTSGPPFAMVLNASRRRATTRLLHAPEQPAGHAQDRCPSIRGRGMGRSRCRVSEAPRTVHVHRRRERAGARPRRRGAALSSRHQSPGSTPAGMGEQRNWFSGRNLRFTASYASLSIGLSRPSLSPRALRDSGCFLTVRQ
jgi:hypothetical protein